MKGPKFMLQRLTDCFHFQEKSTCELEVITASGVRHYGKSLGDLKRVTGATEGFFTLSNARPIFGIFFISFAF